MVTRKDVAKRAGVSVSAVSRAMNSRGYVAKEKKEKIFQAVQELGYRPNPLSNSLKNRQTYQLCFFNPDTGNPFYQEMYEYMVKYAEKRGYLMYLCGSFQSDRFRNMLMDGLILENESAATELQNLLGEQFYIPMVSASYGIPIIKTKNIPYIDVDTYDAMETALAYLKKNGHEKIAYITPYTSYDVATVQSRNVAYENIMKPELGMKFDDYMILSRNRDEIASSFANEHFFQEGLRAADIFHERQLDATAVVCFNDEYALGFMSRLKHLGYKIPDDISVVGFDGIKKRFHETPLLTTVSLNIEKQAQSCVDVLINIVEGKKYNSITSIKPYLIEGETVKKLVI